MEEIPQWLIDDIDQLGLMEVRISCAIHELYDFYANSKVGFDDIDERLAKLTLINDRLEYIDAHILEIKKYIKS